MKTRFNKIILLILCIVISSGLPIPGCSDQSTPPKSFINIKITYPGNDSTVKDTLIRIQKDVSASCSCQKIVEFRIDDSLMYIGYYGPFQYTWNIKNVKGLHKIRTDAYLVGKAQGVDSVYVHINE